MATISIFLRIIFQNTEYILPVAVVFAAVGVVGILIFYALVKEKDWYVILPAGMITGLYGFIILLGFFSYFLKGRSGITFIFIIYLLIGFVLYKKNSKLPKIELNFNIKGILNYLIVFIFLGFTAFLAGTNQYGGDVIAYWGFATSFANGNYPIYSPWQPDFLSIHHKGTYMFEGAVHALTDANLSLIHTLYSYYVIAGGFLLLWGLVRKVTKKELLSVIPSLIAYFSYGAIFLPLPNFIRGLLSPEVEHITGRFPLLLDAKNRLGGASNLPEFIYINHRAAAFAGVILVIVLIYSRLRIKDKLKVPIVAALSVGIISSDEIYLPVLVFIMIAWLIFSVSSKFKAERKNNIKEFLFAGLVFIIFFFIVENAVRNSFFVQSPEPRFRMLTELSSMQARTNSLKSVVLWQAEDVGYFWYLLDLRILIAVSFIFILFTRSRRLFAVSAGIIGGLAAFYTIDHTYYPQNNERFLHLLYQYTGIVLTFAIILSAERMGKLFKNISYLILGTAVLPSVVFALIYLFPLAKKDDYPNYYGHLPTSQALKWMRKNIAQNRVFFLDGYITEGAKHSSYTLQGIQNFGLMVPVSPANIRVHTPDFGFEAYDLMFTLNPEPIKKLKIEYLFVTKKQHELIPAQRKKDLENKGFFAAVYENEEGVVYKVLPGFLISGERVAGGISDLQSLISSGASVYIDYPPNIDGAMRAALFLLLNDNTKIYSEWKSGAFNYIETRIIVNQPVNTDIYEYLLLGTSTDPSGICNCSSLQKLWQTYGLVLYKTKY